MQGGCGNMLIVGQKTATHFPHSINDENDAIEFEAVGQDFDFILVSDRKAYDYANRLGKSTRVVTIRTDANIDFQEDDKIVWDGKTYKISDVPFTDSKLTSLRMNKIITMVG